MKKNWKRYVVLVLSLMVLSSCGANTQGDKKEEMKTEADQSVENKTEEKSKSGDAADKAEVKNKGVKAPEFTLKDWDGNEVALTSLQGKKVYLKFWASWCHFCVKGMPDLEKLVEEDNDFEIYTIVAPEYNGEYSVENFKSWYEKQGFSKNIKILFDEKGATMQAYGVTGYPVNAFIGSDGVLVSKLPGSAENKYVKERMDVVQ